MRRRQVERLEVRFKGHKSDQENMGSVSVRIQAEVFGSKSSFRVYGGAVAFILEMMSCFPSLLDHAPSPRIVVASL